MLSEQLSTTYNSIVSEAIKMVASHVDKNDLMEGVDYASIYAQSLEEFNRISQELKKSGIVILKRSSGDYYRLYDPLNVSTATIRHCRVRVFDQEHIERGYVDFKVRDYKKFKNKYLLKPHFSLLSRGEEMVVLRDPNFTVRAYFPSENF